jgi:hypothetical protein
VSTNFNWPWVTGNDISFATIPPINNPHVPMPKDSDDFVEAFNQNNINYNGNPKLFWCTEYGTEYSSETSIAAYNNFANVPSMIVFVESISK